MSIILNLLFLIICMGLLIKGADFFVSGASSLARKLKVPSMIIGLTIVAIGTSLPELVISVTSALKGSADMSVGNVIGSNIFNTFLILGVVSFFTTINISKDVRKLDLPILFIITTLFCVLGTNGLNRFECVYMLIIFISYIYKLVTNAKRDSQLQLNDSTDIKDYKVWQIVLLLIGGISMVVLGGEFASTTATSLAISFGMSEALVGLTILAVGTSLPELVTSVIAIKKGENDIALGNVIGSNIANILLILGLVGTISPINVSTVILTDMVILTITTCFFYLLCNRFDSLNKKHSYILIMIYAMYLIFTIVRNYCF